MESFTKTSSFIYRTHDGCYVSSSEKETALVGESPLTVYLDGQELVTLLVTPTDVEDLVYGHLCSEGILTGIEDVANVSVDHTLGLVRVRTRLDPSVLKERIQTGGKRVLASGCGANAHFYRAIDFEKMRFQFTPNSPEINSETVMALARELGQASSLYALTKGSHCAGIASADGALLVLRDDIGRHNALDKALGFLLRSEVAAYDKIALVTGRASSDIVIKCTRIGIPVIVSRAAPTDLAVRIANQVGITLVGLARGNSFTVFSQGRRILTQGKTEDTLADDSRHLTELISPIAIKERVKGLGRSISLDYRGKNFLLVGVLQGSFVFMADLLRAIDIPVKTDFMAVSSYGSGTKSSGKVRIVKDLQEPVQGLDVLLVEDIVDTGLTLNYIKNYLSGQKPNSLKVCSLLDKPSRRKTDAKLDYTGFTIPDIFVVGYGLDLGGLYRNLKGIYVFSDETGRSQDRLSSYTLCVKEGAALDPERDERTSALE